MRIGLALRLVFALALLAGLFGLADPALAQTAPRVSAVELVSTPAAGQNNTYKLGDTVRARVTFDKAVDVTGNPVLKLKFDPNFGEKSMTFDASKGRTNVTALEFTWTIVAGNTSTRGIAFYENKLSTGGGAIRSTLTQTHASLLYNRVDHNPSHKVDTTRPVVTGARVSGTTLRVTFSQALGAAANLANSAFAVKKNGSAVDLSGSPAIRGNGVTLTLASGVAASDTVTVSYAKPTTGTGNRLVNAAGNEAQSFTDQNVRTVEFWELDPAPAACGSPSETTNWIASVTSAATTITVTLGSGSLSGVNSGFIQICRPVSSGSSQYTRSQVVHIFPYVARASHTIDDYDAGGGARQSLQADTDYWVRISPDYGWVDLPSPWHYTRTTANVAPSFGADAPATLAVAENSAAGTVVGTVAATDPDTEDTLSYSLASQASNGTDHEPFAIDAEGQITVAAGAMLDRETKSSYAVTVQVNDGLSAVDATHDLTITVTNVVEVTTVELVSTPAAGQDDTYKIGDTVRAKVTFEAAVDVVGNPVLELQFAPNFGPKQMAFDASKGRTNETALEFTYEVVAGDVSTQGIAFFANKLSVGTNVSIRAAGTEDNASLSFAKVDHNPLHKVDGSLPELAATDPVSVTSSAGTDDTYAIGDAVDITVTFTEAVTVTTAGDPVAGPRIAVTLRTGTKHAVYHSGSGTTALVFRYTVADGDSDTDGISVAGNALSLSGGAIADAAGNAAQLQHSALTALTSHKVDGVRPTVTGATVDGTTLRVDFTEALGAAASLANGDFTVKKTPKDGSETSVDLSGSPTISGGGYKLTLTLASEVLATDTGVTVTYVKPTTGAGNRLVDAVGNDVQSFADVAVTRITKVSAVNLVSTPTVDVDGDSTAETYKVGDIVRARVTFDGAVDVMGHPALKLQLQPNSGEKQMTFDSTKPTRNVTELDFTYIVVAGDLSTGGIAFLANKLSAGNAVTIKNAGTLQNANLAFAKIDHNAAHRVDGVRPKLVATDPISVTSEAGTDNTYAIGDAIDITATFDEAVTVVPVGNPVTGPRLAFTVGATTKHAVYHSGSGTTTLVFRYEVEEGAADADGIFVAENALALDRGTIADAAGNTATATQIEHSALAALTDHKVDGVRPTVSSAVAHGRTLRVTFSEALAAASLADGAFTVKKTPLNGSETDVGLSGSPAISGTVLTLTLASELAETDTGVKVSYVRPTTGTGNRIIDAVGNEAASFADVPVGDSRPAAAAKPTVMTDGPSSLRVTWTAPNMAGKPAITDYDVRWFKGSADPTLASQWTAHDHDGTGTATTITGLDPSSTYRVQVRAENVDGEGGWSASGFASTSSTAAPMSCPLAGRWATGDWISSVASTTTSITVTLNEPPKGGALAIYVCLPRVVEGVEEIRWSSEFGLGVAVPAAGNYTIESGTNGLVLLPDTDYWVRVYGQYTEIESQWHYIRTKANLAPSFGSDAPATLAVPENSAAGTVVGTVAATDPNTEDTLSYSLVSQESNGRDQESFDIDADGRITVAAGAALDREKQSSYALTVRVHDGRDTAGDEDTTVDASHDLTVTVTNVVEVSTVELVSTPAEGQNNTYKLGDTVRARVTFDQAVDVTGSPVLELQFDPNFGDKQMTFDTSKVRTGVTSLEFTYTVVANNISRQGIAFFANKLSVGADASIHVAGTSDDALLNFAKVDHNPAHKVDGVLPKLVTTNPVRVTSSPSARRYAIGDTVDFTATFTEAVTVTTAGNPVAGPRLSFDLHPATKHAVYHSGSGTTALVFRYTVVEGDGENVAIAIGNNALDLNSGVIADAAGNAAQTEHSSTIFAHHSVDSVRPTAKGAVVDGTTLRVTFSEALGPANLTNDAFTVKKTPQNAGETNVGLSGSPAISGNTLTLTLATAVLATDRGVKVSYEKPTTGTGNRIIDAVGNDARSFANVPVARLVKVSEVKLVSMPTVDLDGDSTAETYKVGDTVRARVTFGEAVDVVGSPVLKLQFAPNSGEKSMTFDSSGGQTNVTALEFTYEVSAGDVSTQGIAFRANKLSVGQGASIRIAGTQQNASLLFAAVDHNTAHKVEGVLPALVTNDPVSVTSQAGADGIYAIGDAIDITATFDDAVTVVPFGNPVTGPRLAFRVGGATKHAVYHSGSGTTALVFRYTVAEGDADGDGISVGRNALSLNDGEIADATGNKATAAQIRHSALAALTRHRVDGVRPTVTVAAVAGKALRVAFSEPLAAAANIANGAFAVKRNGSAVNLKSFPAIRGNGVTLTLASGVAASDTVTVSYTAPTTGTDNRLVDAVGNEVANFADMAVGDGRPGAPATPTVATPTPSTLRVTWTAPDMTGKQAITGYDVRWFKGNRDPAENSQWTGHHHAGTGTGTRITGLEPSSTYRVQVRAKTAIGEGGWSTSGSGSTSSTSLPPACVDNKSGTARWFSSFTSDSKRIGYTYVDPLPLAEPGPTGFLDVCWHDSGGSNQYIRTSWAAATNPGAGLTHGLTQHRNGRGSGGNFQTLRAGTDYWIRFHHADNEIYGPWNHIRTKPNFAPGFASNAPAALTVAENSAAGTAVGTVAATDRNTEDTVSYSLASQASNGTDHESFDIDADGRITVASGAALDRETQSRYALTVQARDGRNVFGGGDMTVDATRYLAVTVTDVVEVSSVELVSAPTEDADNDSTAETYGLGDTVRARVTFETAVDVVGNPVLELDFDPAAGGERSMTFDVSKGRTNVTALEFTYTVVADDLSVQGIGFGANKLSAGQGGSKKKAGAQADARLAFTAVDHNDAHRVDGVLPALIATGPVSVTSSAGTDETYAIGDMIDFTATFTEAVRVTTTGDPVEGPHLAFTLGDSTEHAVYHSGGGTTALVFRYTVAEGDADSDGISVAGNALTLNGGAIADTAGNPAQLGHPALAALTGHKVDGVRPTVAGSLVSGTALKVTFDEALGAAAGLASGAFTVKKTPKDGSETNVGLSGSPAISGNTLTLTLASELAATDNTVKVSYAKPTGGTGNRLVDAAGNEAASFSDVAVARIAKVTEVKLVSTPAAGQNNTYKVGDAVRVQVAFNPAVDVVGNPVLELDFDPAAGGERSMTFDTSGGRTNVTALNFTYTVAAGDLSMQGIGFGANKLSAGQGVSIQNTVTQRDAILTFAAVDHNANHKVDGVLPALVATGPVSVTSSAGTDDTYSIGDTIDITATFDDAVTVTTAGNPVAAPRLAFTLGNTTKHAVYHSGSGATALVFRYTVTDGDSDANGISVGGNALSLSGGAIADAAGNAAQLEHSALVSLANHKVDGTRPTAKGAWVSGTALKVTFSEPLGAAASLKNDAFTVKKTSGGTETGVSLSGSPAIDGATLTLTLASALAASDTDVTVSYVKPTTGTTNRLVDAVGNEAEGFTNLAVVQVTGVIELVSTPTVDADGDGTDETYKPGDTVRARVTFGEAVDVVGSPVLKLRLDPQSGEKSMIFDATKGRTEVTTLEFTWTVATGDLSTEGIGFDANKLSAGNGASIKVAGTQRNAGLAFSKVDHDPTHKVDGVPPALVGDRSILSVTSSAGPDKTYPPFLIPIGKRRCQPDFQWIQGCCRPSRPPEAGNSYLHPP